MLRDFQLPLVMPAAILGGYALLCLLLAPWFRRAVALIHGIAILGIVTSIWLVTRQWQAAPFASLRGDPPLTTAAGIWAAVQNGRIRSFRMVSCNFVSPDAVGPAPSRRSAFSSRTFCASCESRPHFGRTI